MKHPIVKHAPWKYPSFFFPKKRNRRGKDQSHKTTQPVAQNYTPGWREDSTHDWLYIAHKKHAHTEGSAERQVAKFGDVRLLGRVAGRAGARARPAGRPGARERAS